MVNSQISELNGVDLAVL